MSFLCLVDHFYKNGGNGWTVTLEFPDEMMEEVQNYYGNGRVIKETDPDWNKGEIWEQQYKKG